MKLFKRKAQTEESKLQGTDSVSGTESSTRIVHPFIGSSRGFTSKQRTILTVIAFAIVGTIATYVTNAAQITSEESVRLSNRIQVRLGDSIQEVSAKLGNDLYKLSDRQYEYPGDPNRPIEVVMDVEDGKVVVIHIVSNRSNVLNAAQATYGTDLRQLAARNRRARSVTGELARLRQQALLIEQTRSTQYYIPEPCSKTGTTDLVSLVLKGYEHRLVEDMGGDSCGRD